LCHVRKFEREKEAMDWQAATQSRAVSRLSIHDSEIPSARGSSRDEGEEDEDEEDDLVGMNAHARGFQDNPSHPSNRAAASTQEIMIGGIQVAMLGVTLLFKGETKSKIMSTWTEVANKASKMDKVRVMRGDDPLDKRLAIDLEQQARAIDNQVEGFHSSAPARCCMRMRVCS
jgi:hypothetical protein